MTTKLAQLAADWESLLQRESALYREILVRSWARAREPSEFRFAEAASLCRSMGPRH